MEVSIFEENLRLFLTALGWLVGYPFDPDDWVAVSHGLRDTNREIDCWFDYEFSGNDRTPFAVAFDDSGSGVVCVRVELPGEFASRVQLLADFCWHFHWRDPAG